MGLAEGQLPELALEEGADVVGGDVVIAFADDDVDAELGDSEADGTKVPITEPGDSVAAVTV